MSRRPHDTVARKLPQCLKCEQPLTPEDIRDGYTLCDRCRHVPPGAFYYVWIAAESWFRLPNHRKDPLRLFGKRWRRIRGLSCSLFDHRKFTAQTWQRLRDWLEVRSGMTWNETLCQPVDTIIELLRVADSQGMGKMAAGALAKPQEDNTAWQEENRSCSDTKPEELTRAEWHAYLSRQYAQQLAIRNDKALEKLKERDLYDLLKNEGIPDDISGLPQLSGYKLPRNPDTWMRQNRAGREHFKEQKCTRRASRPHGSSIVRSDQIDRPRANDE